MAVFSHFQKEFLAAIRALLTGGQANPFQAGHVFAGGFQILLELVIVLLEDSLGIEVGRFDLIQVVFHSGCEIHIEQV